MNDNDRSNAIVSFKSRFDSSILANAMSPEFGRLHSQNEAAYGKTLFECRSAGLFDV